jgi:hypothetical protein
MKDGNSEEQEDKWERGLCDIFCFCFTRRSLGKAGRHNPAFVVYHQGP